MHALLLLVITLLLAQSVTAQDNITLQCQTDGDFYKLLYEICERDLVCRHVYFIETGHRGQHNYALNATLPREKRFYERFRRQVVLFNFFAILREGEGDDDDDGWGRNETLSAPLHSFLWPPEWLINITVIISNSTPVACYLSFNLSDPENLLFIHYTLDLLKTFKNYITRHRCPHPNMQLLYDPGERRFFCHCPESLLCKNERETWADMISISMWGVVLFFFILFLTVALFSMRLMR
jgi:hypothetical protein